MGWEALPLCLSVDLDFNSSDDKRSTLFGVEARRPYGHSIGNLLVDLSSQCPVVVSLCRLFPSRKGNSGMQAPSGIATVCAVADSSARARRIATPVLLLGLLGGGLTVGAGHLAGRSSRKPAASVNVDGHSGSSPAAGSIAAIVSAMVSAIAPSVMGSVRKRPRRPDTPSNRSRAPGFSATRNVGSSGHR